MNKSVGILSSEQQNSLLHTLQARFEANMTRHPEIMWRQVQERLESNPEKLVVLLQMETTGGEPDVISFQSQGDQCIFIDCSSESPKERRSLCYDREALDSRKENKPKDSVLDVAKQIGIDLLTEVQYRELQKLGNFDTKTSSWIQTPREIRNLGGALFCDKRYNHIFAYHNGADSYYAARGFRGLLRI